MTASLFCRACKKPIKPAEDHFYHGGCEACYLAAYPARTEDSALHVMVLNGIIEVLSGLEDETRELQVCEALINIVMDGGFCRDKQPMALLVDARDPGMRRLHKMQEARRILTFRSSIKSAH